MNIIWYALYALALVLAIAVPNVWFVMRDWNVGPLEALKMLAQEVRR